MEANYIEYHEEMSALMDYIRANSKDSSSLIIEKDHNGIISINTHFKHLNGDYTYKGNPDSTEVENVMRVCGLSKRHFDEIIKKMNSANAEGISVGYVRDDWSDYDNILYRHAGSSSFRYYFLPEDDESNHGMEESPNNVRINDSVVIVAKASIFGHAFRP